MWVVDIYFLLQRIWCYYCCSQQTLVNENKLSLTRPVTTVAVCDVCYIIDISLGIIPLLLPQDWFIIQVRKIIYCNTCRNMIMVGIVVKIEINEKK